LVCSIEKNRIENCDEKKKILEEIQSRKRNIRFKEAEKILLQYGYAERRSKKGTSHRIFSHPKLEWNITLVSHGKNDVLPIYQVQDILKSLNELQEKL